MKYFLVISVILVGLILVGCSNKEPSPVPVSTLNFVLEENPDYIGSYSIQRKNLSSQWTEWGEWTPLESVIGREIVCFGYYGGSGTFRSRSDYEWIEIKYDKRMCLELKKRK